MPRSRHKVAIQPSVDERAQPTYAAAADLVPLERT